MAALLFLPCCVSQPALLRLPCCVSQSALCLSLVCVNPPGVNGEPLQDESANDADSTDEECPKRVTKARHSKRKLAVTTKETRGKRQK